MVTALELSVIGQLLTYLLHLVVHVPKVAVLLVLGRNIYY